MAWPGILPVLVIAAAALAMAVILWRQRAQSRSIEERSQELERLSLELIRANRMKSEFLANISHELRTPLNAIVGFIELLQEGVYGELTLRQSVPVDRIQASAAHLRHLVDQVLDLARIAAGRMEVHPEPIDVRSFVRDVLTEMEPLANERGLPMGISAPELLPRASADPLHLRQILVNLVGNALKFTDRGSVTLTLRHVRTHPEGKQPPKGDTDRWWIAVEIRDTGIGIAPDDQARVFDEFEQVDAGSRSDSMRRGTGLGLPISKRLAHLMGGTITLRSALGDGSTFTLWLRAMDLPSGGDAEDEAKGRRGGSAGRPDASPAPGGLLPLENPLHLRE